MGSPETIRIEVAYALPQEQVIRVVAVAPGATLEAAILRSGVLERFPEIDLKANRVGIFGKLSTLDHPLRAGDRVEIYRPLIADPKDIRRQRAAQGKKTKKGAGAD